MAEPKDYISILWRDRSWISEDPKTFLTNLKNRLIEEGAKPGTGEYEDAFMSIIGLHNAGTGRGNIQAGGLTLMPHMGGANALNYLNKNMTIKEIQDELGLNQVTLRAGKDLKGATRNASGEVILANDPYQRNQFSEREYTAEGLAGYRPGTPGTVRTGKWDSLSVKLSDLKKVPDEIFSLFKDFPIQRQQADGSIVTEERPIPQELIDMGMVPGAEVTPELIKKYEEWSLKQLSPQVYSEYTGQPYAPGYDLLGNYVGEGAVDEFGNLVEGTGTGTTGTKNVTGTPTGYDPVTKTFKASDGRQFTDQQAYTTYQTTLAGQKAERQSAYDLLYSQFKQYGLESLVEPLKGLITSGASPSEFTIRLRETPQYQKRFAANAARIQKGLTAISEAEYLGLEDQYQNIMRNYGLPAEYYTRGDMGVQEGFTKLIANDVSSTELEDRVLTAQQRVLNSNPEVLASLKAFYPDITNGDILAYTLDPTKGLTDIKRKVTAAEIGGAATQAGLGLTGTRAAELGAAGVTKAQAQQGFQTVAEVAPRGGMLADIYKQSPYTQTTAEAEVFGLAGSADAARQRKKLTSLETAAFSGSAGAGAIARDRAGTL